MIELERERKKKNAKKRKVRNRIVTSTPRSQQQQQKWWIKIYIRWMNEWKERERRERNSWIKNEEIKLKRNETEIRKIYDDESLYHLKLHAHNLV